MAEAAARANDLGKGLGALSPPVKCFIGWDDSPSLYELEEAMGPAHRLGICLDP